METQHETTIMDRISAAIQGDYGPEQQRIAETGVLWIGTLLDKNNDYGGSVWEVPVLAPDVSEDAAIRCRMSDKVKRLANLFSGTRASVDESIEDTVGDLGAYCLLWLSRPRKKIEDFTSGEWKPPAQVAAEVKS